MLDELEYRKDNFEEANSVPVEFLGGMFFLPKPWLEVRPIFKGGKPVSSYRCFTSGPAIDALLDAIAATESDDDHIVAVASLAAWMLQYHYDLGDAELDQLLAFRAYDPASLAWTERVMEVATGRSGPKLGAGIAGSP